MPRDKQTELFFKLHDLRTGLLLLLLEESDECHTGNLDNLETHTGNITLGVTTATETSNENLQVKSQ